MISDENFVIRQKNTEHDPEYPVRSSCEPYNTPTKTNKFVYSYSGILSATE